MEIILSTDIKNEKKKIKILYFVLFNLMEYLIRKEILEPRNDACMHAQKRIYTKRVVGWGLGGGVQLSKSTCLH